MTHPSGLCSATEFRTWVLHMLQVHLRRVSFIRLPRHPTVGLGAVRAGARARHVRSAPTLWVPDVDEPVRPVRHAAVGAGRTPGGSPMVQVAQAGRGGSSTQDDGERRRCATRRARLRRLLGRLLSHRCSPFRAVCGHRGPIGDRHRGSPWVSCSGLSCTARPDSLPPSHQRGARLCRCDRGR